MLFSTEWIEERQQLEVRVRGGKPAARKVKRAQILLAADSGSNDEAIAQNVGVGTSTGLGDELELGEGPDLALIDAGLASRHARYARSCCAR
jgi:hypothetical protein